MNIENKERPFVSILIPTYNGAQFIVKTIQSVRRQTFENYELIICDDSSVDQTLRILEKYNSIDSRISIFKYSENIGLAGNWNRCLEKSRGKYIKMLFQDDILYPNYLEETINILENYKTVSLVCSFEKTIGEFTKERKNDVFPGTRELNGKWSQNQIIKKGNWIGAPTATLFRKKDIEKIGVFDNDFPCSLDWEMWLRFLGFGNLYVIPKVLYSTRIHLNQESTNCIRNQGFIKDRLSIFYKIKKQPRLYGRETWDVSEKIYGAAVRNLLHDTISRKPLNLLNVIRFLNQYQSPVSSWIATAEVFLKYFYKSCKGFLTKN